MTISRPTWAPTRASRAAMRDGRTYATAAVSSPAAYERRHAPDLRRCARHLAGALAAAGLEHVRERQPPGSRPPVVTADWLHAPGAPTLLVYGHYDVQPADGARDHWDVPPFQPVIRGD